MDIDPSTLNIDVGKIEKKITKNTKAIMLVHILGLPVKTKTLKTLKKKYGLKIIEDACEAIGRPGKDFPVSQVGDICVYGFHENKQLTTGGEGGMITTNNKALDQKCRSMRDQGRSTKKDWINNVMLGFNFRMTEMQAAIGRSQLKNVGKILRFREKAAEKYSSKLNGIKNIKTPHSLTSEKRSWFTYFIIFDKPSDRDAARKTLLRNNIASSTNYFPPIYKFPMYKKFGNNFSAITEYVSERLLVLPFFYGITDKEINLVVKTVKKALD